MKEGKNDHRKNCGSNLISNEIEALNVIEAKFDTFLDGSRPGSGNLVQSCLKDNNKFLK